MKQFVNFSEPSPPPYPSNANSKEAKYFITELLNYYETEFDQDMRADFTIKDALRYNRELKLLHEGFVSGENSENNIYDAMMLSFETPNNSLNTDSSALGNGPFWNNVLHYFYTEQASKVLKNRLQDNVLTNNFISQGKDYTERLLSSGILEDCVIKKESDFGATIYELNCNDRCLWLENLSDTNICLIEQALERQNARLEKNSKQNHANNNFLNRFMLSCGAMQLCLLGSVALQDAEPASAADLKAINHMEYTYAAREKTEQVKSNSNERRTALSFMRSARN